MQRLKLRVRKRRGFTLVELLVVIAILSIFAGGVGLYRLNQTPSGRLNAAVRMVSGLVTRARTQAQISGNLTRIVIDTDASSMGRLKDFFVCELREGEWQVIGNATDLPRGIGVVPSDGSLLEGDWNDQKSSFSNNGAHMSFNPDGRGDRQFVYIEFSPDGRVELFEESDYLQPDVNVGGQLPQVFLSAMRRKGATEFVFDHPELRMGVLITANGNPVLSSL